MWNYAKHGEVEVRSHLLLRALPSLHFTELAGFGLLILCFYNSVKMLKFRHLYNLCLSLSQSEILTGGILKIIHCENLDVGARNKGSRIGRKPDASPPAPHKSPDTRLPQLKISRNEKCETSELSTAGPGWAG